MKSQSTTKTIYLTFDYELFLRRSGTPQACLFDPTQRIIDMLERYDVKAVFFVDILYYQQLMHHSQHTSTAQRFKAQIQQLAKLGHQIELHIHSHWPNAQYRNGQWFYDVTAEYCLQNFTAQQIHSIITDAVQTLVSIVREVVPDYKPSAFRAGGLCILPFKPLANALRINGLTIDSSVARNMTNQTMHQQFDFKHAPKKARYYFDESPLTESNIGSFTEYQIASYTRTFFDRLTDKLFAQYPSSMWQIAGDGQGLAKSTHTSLVHRLCAPLMSQPNCLSLEACTPPMLLQKIKQHHYSDVVLLSHPKLLTALSFECLSQLLQTNYIFKTFDSNER